MKKKKIIITSITSIILLGFIIWGIVFAVMQHKKVSSHYIKHGEELNLSENDWQLTFEDNFNFFDDTKWKIDVMLRPNKPELNGIRRAAYYTDDKDIIFTENGNLYLRTKWKNGKYGEGWYTGFISTSREIDKDNIQSEDYVGFSQTGGYFECRCKVAKAEGIWSAFWLMPDNNKAFSKDDVQFSGEDGIEIDIMESPHSYLKTSREKNQNIHVIHADGYGDNLKTVRSKSLYVPKMYSEFHTYGFMWDENKYTFYIDGRKTWETTHVYDGKEMGICKVPEYLLLSTEVAGTIEDGKLYPGLVKDGNGNWVENWCGNPDKNKKDKNYDFVVDYVRCYKKK